VRRSNATDTALCRGSRLAHPPPLVRTLQIQTDPETQMATAVSRKLGLLVIRGTQVSVISPQDGMEEISNPFAVDEAAAAEEEVPTVVTED
jgi:hypothetical protein